MRIRILGIGMGPQHVTAEVAQALRGCDYVLAVEKRPGDELAGVRGAVCAAYAVPLVTVPDPARDRSAGLTHAEYSSAVVDWHDARAAAYRQVLEQRDGTVGFLVWGDPALYDSTIRVVERLDVDFDVLPGISAPQVLAARHRIVLHEIGRPVHVTTARLLREAVAAGQDNIVVMLGGAPDLAELAEWSIWWGANLGTTSEELVAGRVHEVTPEIEAARERAKANAGWVMDVYLLRRAAG